MELEKIQFCNSSVYKISNAYFVETINKNLEKILECELKTSKNIFPGSQPVALEKKNLEILKKNKYVVCEKSDGERYLLLFLYIENNPLCLLLNRNNTFYFVELNIATEMFEGTMFDGELIKTKEGQWNYLIHDCIAYNGRSYMKISHNKRYGAIIDFITKMYSYQQSNPFYIKTKLFYNYTPELEQTWEHIKQTTENNIDGLIFTPVHSPIVIGRQNDLFKWKNGSNHTIDLLVKLIHKNINAYYSGNKIFKKINDPVSQEYKQIFNFCGKEILIKGVIVEFKYSVDSGILTPYRLRQDKEFPNSKLTVDNTITNIRESLEIQDLA
jgi:hypothetical protein